MHFLFSHLTLKWLKHPLDGSVCAPSLAWTGSIACALDGPAVASRPRHGCHPGSSAGQRRACGQCRTAQGVWDQPGLGLELCFSGYLVVSGKSHDLSFPLELCPSMAPAYGVRSQLAHPPATNGGPGQGRDCGVGPTFRSSDRDSSIFPAAPTLGMVQSPGSQQGAHTSL